MNTWRRYHSLLASSPVPMNTYSSAPEEHRNSSGVCVCGCGVLLSGGQHRRRDAARARSIDRVGDDAALAHHKTPYVFASWLARAARETRRPSRPPSPPRPTWWCRSRSGLRSARACASLRLTRGGAHQAGVGPARTGETRSRTPRCRDVSRGGSLGSNGFRGGRPGSGAAASACGPCVLQTCSWKM